MKQQQQTFYQFNTIVVGSGAAGLNAALRLYELGQKSVAIVTEGLRMGTSRNTGSDKQTYYKLSLSGEDADSVQQMAQTLFDGGCVDGDIALAEAAGSARAFYHWWSWACRSPQTPAANTSATRPITIPCAGAHPPGRIPPAT